MFSAGYSGNAHRDFFEQTEAPGRLRQVIETVSH
jgi:hypothetical protein